MSAPQLRDYQHDLIKRLRHTMRSARRVVVQSPTGSGKTVLTAHMIRRAAEKNLRCWFLVHRRELLKQTSDALWLSGVPHGLIAAGRTPTHDLVQVATVQTLVKRLGVVPPPSLLVIDEAHHTAAASYRQIVEHCAGAHIVGLTATPCRTDGRGLDDLFDAIVLGPAVADLMDAGYLARYRVICPPGAVDVSGVHIRGGDYARDEMDAIVGQRSVVAGNVEHYLRFIAPRSCLVYTVSRAHARLVEAAYREAGVDAMYCGGDTPADERNVIVDRFKRGKLPVIVSVDLFSEGLDVPGLHSVQLLRPTKSLALHLQQVGRALRPEAGKEYALILDQTSNSHTHGLPDDERAWTLEGKKRSRKAEPLGPPIRNCPECFALYHATLRECPACGHETEATHRTPEEVEGELVEMSAAEFRAQRHEIGRARTLQELVQVAKKRGKQISWAGILFAARTGKDRAAMIREAYRIARAG